MKAPRPGRDYPRTQRDFYHYLDCDEACNDWLERLRWGSSNRASLRKLKSEEIHGVKRTGAHFICPDCACEDAWLITGGRRCKGCRRRVHVLTYGLYQIDRDLNTRCKVTVGGKDITEYDYPQLNGEINTLKKMTVSYHADVIAPKLWHYGLLK